MNLNDCQFKSTKYSYRSTYMNSIVTTNQTPIKDTQKLQKEGKEAYCYRKSSKHKGRFKKKK